MPPPPPPQSNFEEEGFLWFIAFPSSQSLLNHNAGDDFTSCIENLLINLGVPSHLKQELEFLKLCEDEAPAQDGVDLKFSLVLLSGYQTSLVWW